MIQHLPVAPILLPLLMAAAILLVERRGIAWQRALGWVGTLGLMALAIALVDRVDAQGSLV